ncbi:MAG TPA: methylmalonyl Co-A mutase-associated GTPase MeaB [Acidobacteriota bacterium]|jgi:LAO/AO transport system kinase|nr:methylmalonyl Co-A mutase-associated GTPase MeaB [Acidobacteriota bacterium]
MNVSELSTNLLNGDIKALARAISWVENDDPRALEILKNAFVKGRDVPIIGITGPAGVGKSSLTDQLIAVYRSQNKKVGVVAVDPSSPFTGGAILGDRIRMQRHYTDKGVFIRSMATRGKLGGIAATTFDVIDLINAAGYDIILIETVGVGQDEVDIVKIAHTTVVVLMPGLGDEVQAMKAGLMEIADLLVVNKSDRPEAEKMEAELQASLNLYQSTSDWHTPILKTVATNNIGVDALAQAIESHQQYLHSSGKLQQKLLNQSKQRLIDSLEYQITSRIIEEGVEQFGVSQKISDIAARKTDPRSVVLELLEHFRLSREN